MIKRFKRWLKERSMEPPSGSYELDILRTLDGREVQGVVSGAAMWQCATSLKRQGFADGFYKITDKGREHLAQLRKEGKTP